TASSRAIAQACGARLRPVVLELGGKSPHIVFADADLERARKVVADGIFYGGGQSCVAGSRIFVEASVHDAFLKAICDQAGEFRMGAPNDVAVTMGPMVSFQHREHVEKAVEVARAEGAKVLTGGSVPSQGELTNGAYYPATV